MLTAVGMVFTSREQQFSFHLHQTCTFLAPVLLLCCQQSPRNRAPVSLFIFLINTWVLSCQNETETNKKYNCLGQHKNEPCKGSGLTAHWNSATKSSCQRINNFFPLLQAVSALTNSLAHNCCGSRELHECFRSRIHRVKTNKQSTNFIQTLELSKICRLTLKKKRWVIFPVFTIEIKSENQIHTLGMSRGYMWTWCQKLPAPAAQGPDRQIPTGSNIPSLRETQCRSRSRACFSVGTWMQSVWHTSPRQWIQTSSGKTTSKSCFLRPTF